jgi:phosphonate transport system substrate-binding protein
MEAIEVKTVRLIYVYSQEDKEKRDKLSQFLRFQRPQVEEWHEDDILPGEQRLEEIYKNMAMADIILLLLSSDFLALHENIWSFALDLYRSKRTRLIPIHLSHVNLPQEFEDLQLLALPRNGQPISTWNSSGKAYKEIAQEVNKVVQKVHASRTKRHVSLFETRLFRKVSSVFSGRLDGSFQKNPKMNDYNGLKVPITQSSEGMSRKKFLTITGSVGLVGATVSGGAIYLKMLSELDALKGINGLQDKNVLKIGSELKSLKGAQATIEAKTFKDIRITFIPTAIPTDVDPTPLVNALQQQLSLPVSLELYPKSYSECITTFGRREFNVFWGNPYGYVIAAARYGVRPILQLKTRTQNDKSHYYTHILTRRASNIHSVAELGGRSLSFVDKYSTSGYLYPRQALRENKLDEDQVKTTYVGTHAESLDRVVSGRTDAGAVSEEFYESPDGSYISPVYTDTLIKYNVKDEDIVSIYRSEPIPMGPVVVHADILDSDVRKLQSAFLLLDDPTLLRSLGVSGFGSVTDATYKPIRDIAQDLGIDLATV